LYLPIIFPIKIIFLAQIRMMIKNGKWKTKMLQSNDAWLTRLVFKEHLLRALEDTGASSSIILEGYTSKNLIQRDKSNQTT
jgi:hypothetical protein